MEQNVATAILEGTTKNVLKVVSSNLTHISITQHEVGLSEETIINLEGVFHEGPLSILGKKQSQSILTVKVSSSFEKGVIYLNKEGMQNLRVKSNDHVKVYKVEDEKLYDAHIVTIAGIKESLAGIKGDIFKNLIEPYFESIPEIFLSTGSIYKIKAGIKSIEIKVMEITTMKSATSSQEESGEEKVQTARIVQDTGILMTGEIARNEIEKELAKVGYEDIGGCSKQLAKIREAIEIPLKHPELYRKIGIKPVKGVLLHGPPGTGKTMIAKAIANECGAFILTINGPEIMSKMAGESESNLRKAFETAEKHSPAIIFIDEIDSIAPSREKSTSEGERRIVSQLLTLMDGMNSVNSRVVVLAATNRPNSLDAALRRFGRFDKEIEVGVPDEVGRLEILSIHTKNMKISQTVDLMEIASNTHGFTGSDIAAMCHEAATYQLHEKIPLIDLDADSIPAPILSSLEINEDNFRKAINHTVPSSLRETIIQTPNVKWSDIGGLASVKKELMEAVSFPVNHADKYLKFGQSPSTGILLYGPPGCGKTLIAKAVATESKANFISIKGPELISKYIGDSESNVRAIFDKARGAAPSILFFDEIDSVGKSRGSDSFSTDGGASDRMLNQILVEMDGMSAKKDVFVIGATNRPQLLDSALMRPGRLDQLIYINLPDRASRISIFKAKLKNTPLADDVSLEWMAEVTEGFSGADITEICQRATKEAIRESIRLEMLHGDTLDYDPVPALTSRFFRNALKSARKSVARREIESYEAFANSMNVNINTAIENENPEGELYS